MTDVAISYSTRDRAQVLDIVQTLWQQGLSVWLDNALELEHDSMDLGVPAGQRHWDVISRALDDASVTLVLDSPNWRNSDYCWDEYQHSVVSGSRVAVLPLDADVGSGVLETDGRSRPEATWPVTSVSDLVSRIGDGEDVVTAHSRLLARSGAAAPKWWSPDLSRIQRDAVVMADTDIGRYGLRLSEPVGRLIQSADRASTRRGRLIFGVAMVVLSLLLLGASISLLGNSRANAARAEAEVEASFQSSLDLARQSERSLATSDALRLAQSAIEAYPTEAASNASLQAAVRANERSRFQIDFDGTAYAAAIPDDSSTIVVMEIAAFQSEVRLWMFDGVTGEVMSKISLREGLAVSSQISISPDGHSVGLVTLDGLSLVRVNVSTEQVEEWESTASIVGSGFLDDGTLIAATTEGLILAAAPGGSGGGALSVAHDTGRTLRAFTVFNNRASVAYLSDVGTLYRSDVAAGRFDDRDDATIRLFEGPPPSELLEGSGTWESRDLLYSCGNDHFVAVRLDASAAWLSGDLTVIPTPSTRLMGTGDTQSAACAGGILVTAHPARREVRSIPVGQPIPSEVTVESLFNRTILASNVDGSTLGVVRSSGITDLIDVSKAGSSRAMGAATVILPFDGLRLVVDEDGSIARIMQGQDALEPAIGQTPFAVSWNVVWVSDHYVVSGPEGLVELFADGRTTARPVEIRGRIGLCGDEIVCAADGESVTVFGPSFEETIDLSRALADGEGVFEIRRVDDRSLVIGTTAGRIILIDSDTHEVLSQTQSSVDSFVAIETVPEKGLIFAFGPDGVLRMYDRNLGPLRTRFIGPAGYSIRTACDDSFLILSSQDRDVLVIDAETLLTVRTIDASSAGARTFIAPPGACSELVGLDIKWARTPDGDLETEARLETVPIGIVQDLAR